MRVADRPSSPAAKIVAALDRLSRAQRSHRQATASRLGLTPLQADLLTILADGAPPEPEVGRLAAELGVAQPTVTDALVALERKGLIRREAHHGDRRRSVTRLTSKGENMATQVAAGDGALVAAVAGLDLEDQAAAVRTLVGLISRYLESGVITVARTCLTCRHHSRANDGSHYCALLDTALAQPELRVNCPEHELVSL